MPALSCWGALTAVAPKMHEINLNSYEAIVALERNLIIMQNNTGCLILLHILGYDSEHTSQQRQVIFFLRKETPLNTCAFELL